MGPRPDGRGKTVDVDGASNIAERQWGRGQTAAESSLANHSTIYTQLRQWGRGQTAAESESVVWASARFHTRQWGRGQTAAERQRRTQCYGKAEPASMGPRPDGRGKTVDGKNQHLPVTASMGPRPDGRGKLPLRYGMQHEVQASMGPRPDGRGKRQDGAAPDAHHRRQWGRGQTAAESRRQCPPGNALRRVNGAAARRPRKDENGHEGHNRIVASMGPRPDGRGKLHLRCVERNGGAGRQWGRGQTAAESPSPAPRAGHVDLRQWGRGQTAAERRRPPHGAHDAESRQWGRGQTAAESARTLPASDRGLRVNGAAARRPRKDWCSS